MKSKHGKDGSKKTTGKASDPASQFSRSQYDTSKKSKSKKKLKRWQKVVIGLGVVIVIAAGTAFAYINSIDRNLALEPKEMAALKQELAPPVAGEPYYILLLGSDARSGETNARSDTIMLCRLDPTTKQVSILSIPRDTRVELEGVGTNKINAAMAYGGPAGAVKAVSDFAGVKISHFVLIDFENFTGIVDTLGGVTVNVPLEAEYDGVWLEPGLQTLNAEQALTFVRVRKSYELGDFQRAANQRIFLKAVAKEVLSVPLNEMPGLISNISTYVETDMTTTDLIGLANDFRGMDMDSDMYTGQVPATTGTIDGVSYVLTLDDLWATVRQQFVDGVVPFVDASNQPAVIE
jgi:LCP family protein required for cell wall assembly